MKRNNAIDYNRVSNHRSSNSTNEEATSANDVRPIVKKEDSAREVKVVNTEKLNVRSSPSTTKKNVVRILNHGDIIRIKDENENWAYIADQHKPTQEFVMKKFLKEV